MCIDSSLCSQQLRVERYIKYTYSQGIVTPQKQHVQAVPVTRHGIIVVIIINYISPSNFEAVPAGGNYYSSSQKYWVRANYWSYHGGRTGSAGLVK